MGEVERGIRNAGRAVSNVGKQVTESIARSDLGKFNRDVTDAIKRSDVGKVTGALTVPARASADALIDVSQGQVQRGINRVIGGAMSIPGTFAHMSPTMREFYTSETGNLLTLGMGRDMVEVGDRGRDIASTGRGITQSDISSTTRLGLRAGAIAGGAYLISGAAAAAGGYGALASSAGGYAGAAATTVGSAVLPIVGDAVKDSFIGARRPASPSPTYSVQASSMPSPTILLVGALGLVLSLIIFGKKRRKK